MKKRTNLPFSNCRGQSSSLLLVGVLGVAVVLGLAYAGWHFLQTDQGKRSAPAVTSSDSPSPTTPDPSPTPSVTLDSSRTASAAPEQPSPDNPSPQRHDETPVMPTANDQERGEFEFLGTVQDKASGQPVVFFEVFLIPESEGELETVAPRWRSQKFRDRNGKFRITEQQPGIYNLKIKTLTHKDYVREGVKIPQRADDFLAMLDRGAWIEGTVVDNFGMPLDGMEVFLKPVKLDPGQKYPQRRLAKTDGSGHFEFTKLPTGVYTMSAGPIGDPGTSHPEFYLGEEKHLDKSFRLDRRATLKVMVVREDGPPIPRARVTLTGEENSQSRTAFSDINGLAYLKFLSGGQYKMTIRATGYSPLEDEVYVNEGDALPKEVVKTLTFTPR